VRPEPLEVTPVAGEAPTRINGHWNLPCWNAAPQIAVRTSTVLARTDSEPVTCLLIFNSGWTSGLLAVVLDPSIG